MGEMTCPICGRSFDDSKYVIGENGNPICPECASNEEATAPSDDK